MVIEHQLERKMQTVNPRPVNIVHVSGQLTMGGLEKLLVVFARLSDRKRVNLTFVCLGEGGSPADEIKQLGWPVTVLNSGTGLRPHLFIRLAQLFREARADVVHTHNTEPLFYSGIASRIAGVKKIVHTRHGQDVGRGMRGWLALRLSSLAAKHIACVSRDSARLALSAGLPANKLCTILNGIDCSRFPTGDLHGGTAISVGRLSPEKDLATLIHATNLIVEVQPSFRLRIAGNGAVRQSLSDLTSKLGLTNVIEFLGEVHDVPKVLSTAALFVNSSTTEGISLTIIEAMAAGMPVVATEVGGTPEIVVNGETGFTVRPQDPRALADAIITLWKDFELRRTMGQKGRVRANKYFSIECMLDAYDKLYGITAASSVPALESLLESECS